MPKQLIFVIPKRTRDGFKKHYDIMHENCPVGCTKAQFELNENTGVFKIAVPEKMTDSHLRYCKAALKSANALPIKESIINKYVKLLEKVTSKKVKLVENNEANKNLAVESLNAVSDTLNMLKQNISQATDQVQQLSGLDLSLSKLRGLSAIVDTSITDVSEIITTLTGIQTKENSLDDSLEEDDSDSKGVVMNIDDATNNLDDVSKIIDKDQNVIIDDSQNN